ncbi:MAG: PHP domain-containing protein [Clostridiales bacterium]|nr:PHP domain-containing protein [Clostridiales bacterium]
MRFDMHCHTKEGSIDAKISLREYVLRLKELGYDGMLLTDHNSYKGYRWYLKNKEDKVFEDFTLLKGIEYDTCDGGHMLIIMPEHIRLPILELRGLPVRLLIEIVHAFRGILGPAHPTGEKYMSITNCKYYQKHPEIIQEFDFMEVYNSCITPEENRCAARLADQYGLPGTAGSDTHKTDCVGLAWTDIEQPIHSESDLIRYLKTAPVLSCGGSHYSGSNRDHMGAAYDFMLRLFYLYNKASGSLRHGRREVEIEELIALSANLKQSIMDSQLFRLVQKQFWSRRRRNRVRRQFHISVNSDAETSKDENSPRERLHAS